MGVEAPSMLNSIQSQVKNVETEFPDEAGCVVMELRFSDVKLFDSIA